MFLAFNYRGTDFKFIALPFGLFTSPRVFTQVASMAVKELRHRGLPLCISTLLVGARWVAPRCVKQHQTNSRPPEEPRMGDTQGEIKADTESAKQVPQGSPWIHWGIDQSVIRKGYSAHTAGPACAQQMLVEGKNLATASRPAGQPCKHHSMLQVVDEANPSTSINLLSQRVQPREMSPYISPLDPQHLLWWATPKNWAKGRPFHQDRLLTSITSDVWSIINLNTFFFIPFCKGFKIRKSALQR